MLLLHHQD